MKRLLALVRKMRYRLKPLVEVGQLGAQAIQPGLHVLGDPRIASRGIHDGEEASDEAWHELD